MRVKKFEARSMKEALQMVKQELGPDAVILGARDNRKSFGLAGETSIEVTAAVSESTLHKKKYVESRMTTTDRDKFSKSNAKTQREIIERMVENRVRENQAPPEKVFRPISNVSYIDIQDDEIEPGPRRNQAYGRASGRNVSDLLQDFAKDFDTSKAAPKTNTQDRALDRVRAAVREATQNNIFTEDEIGPKAARGASSGGLEMVQANTRAELQNGEINNLKGEINRLQQMLETFQRVPQTMTTMHPGADYGLSYDVSFMFQKLVEVGVSAENAAEILKAAEKAIDPIQIKKHAIVDAWVARWFLNQVQTVPAPMQGRVHLFVGGAGSGKTSTLVKMASQLVVKEKKKIAILSADTFKVGAIDQLKIYCQILNVPFAVIRNRKDWEWVMSQLGHVDHILVDYPSLQLRDLDEIHLLKSLLPPDGTLPMTHFCVSATTKDSDADEISRRYMATDYTDLIFTNLDQSVQHGIIYNMQRKTGRPLHSFGIGSRIPEDFELASKERVLDLMFKLTKIKRDGK